MRKGTKRKAAAVAAEEEDTTVDTNNNDDHSTEDNTKIETIKPAKRGRRSKPSKPESESEYFSEQRDFEDLWKHVFPVGTEWDQLDKVYQNKWNFSNLETAFEEGGDLYGQKVYMFGCTEPRGQSDITCIPVVVAVVSPIPPSDKIGINSVQMDDADAGIPLMRQMKMDWVPYIPFGDRQSQVERLKPQIFILSCLQRRAGLRNLKIERVMKFTYCLPYFKNPFKEEEVEQSTIVDIMYPIDSKAPIVCEFDWELDELEEFADELVEEEEKDAFKEFVKEKVCEAKKANRKAREARKKEIAEISEETKTAIENMKFYKFYPVASPDTPDVCSVKSPFINRYYGKAHQVLDGRSSVLPKSTNALLNSGAGHVDDIGGLTCYISCSSHSKSALLLTSDAYGYKAPKLRKLADKVAAAGFYVVVPDYFQGDIGEGPIHDWLKRHNPVPAAEVTKSLIQALKGKGLSQVGAAGFCWGAKVVVELSKSAAINAAVLLHPSFVSVDDISEVKVPIAILGAEIDQYSPPEVVKQFEAALQAKPEVDHFVKVFPGVSHSWTVRYADDDEVATTSANEAHQDMLNWFTKFINV